MRLRFLVAPIFIWTSHSFAVDIPKDFPKDLIYNDAPISPLCFTSEESSEIVTLKQCSLHLDPGIKKVGVSEDLIKLGYIGFDYKIVEDDSEENSESKAYSYYKVIGYFNGRYTLYMQNSGGGSGKFSSVSAVSRKEDNLKIESLVPGGDRCNGGIEDVNQKVNLLTYSKNLTPYDFLEINKQNPHHLRAYDDVDACAVCCVATASFQIDLNHPTQPAKLLSVEFSEELSGSDDSTEDLSYSACFYKLAKQYVNHQKGTLTEPQLKTFMDRFNVDCVKLER